MKKGKMGLWPSICDIAEDAAKLDEAGDLRPRCVLLTTGAMNPPHRGHVNMM